MSKLYNLLRWPWTPWVDVQTFTHGYEAYVLQGRRNRITGRSQFAVRAMRQWYRAVYPGNVTQEQLQKAGLWIQPQQQPTT
jgi:hypothetical protein